MKKVLAILILIITNANCYDGSYDSRQLLDLLPIAVSGEQPPPDEGIPNTVVPFEGDVKFALYDGFESAGGGNSYVPVVLLYMQSEKQYECCNYGIDRKIAINGNTVTIEILGIIKPGVCLTAFGPAVYRAPMPLAAGEYVFRFVNGARTDEYTVQISGDSIRITPAAREFSVPEFGLYWRYPEKTLALSCQAPSGFEFVCDDFKTLLTTLFPLEEYSFPAEGTVCYSLYTGSSHFGDEIPGLRYFQYDSEADYLMMEGVLRTFCEDVLSGIEGIGITLRNWENKPYYSWMY